jgi:Cu+-exporting ATPase
MSKKTDSKQNQLKDPVCDMTVSTDSEHSFLHRDQQYYFCSEHCLHKFKERPEQFLHKKKAPPLETGSDSNTYTCPMHPEVIQDHPGSCPKCGMALEPTTSSGEEKNEELIDMSRRFWACTALSLPVSRSPGATAW